MPPSKTAVGLVASAITKLETSEPSADLRGATGQMLDFLAPEMPFMSRFAISNRWLFAPLVRHLFEGTPSTNAMIRTTTAVTMIGGGIKPNVLPTSAWAIVNFRIIPGQTIEEVVAYVVSVVADKRIHIEEHERGSEPSSVSDPSSAEFKTLQRSILEVLPDVLVTPALTVVTTDSRHYKALTRNIFRFMPIRMNKEDLRRPHGINERIALENYIEMIQFLAQYLRNTAS